MGGGGKKLRKLKLKTNFYKDYYGGQIKYGKNRPQRGYNITDIPYCPTPEPTSQPVTRAVPVAKEAKQAKIEAKDAKEAKQAKNAKRKLSPLYGRVFRNTEDRGDGTK